jgi:ADP-dependent NAD(P)H-hydrate dehydratase
MPNSLPPRQADSHKGDFGKVLLVGGARGMSGAIVLSGMAALRSGAGLVQLAVPECCLDVVAGYEPSYMTAPLAADEAGRISLAARDRLKELAESATCLAIGPGLGQSPGLMELVVEIYRDWPQPAVFDADALNALAKAPGGLERCGGPRVLTPHPGEFQRLIAGDTQGALKTTSKSPREEQEQAAIELAKQRGITLILKGHRSLVTDGALQAHNSTGNPGMARGGSGDVLTGILAALLAQGFAPYAAAVLAAHVHGLAGDLASEKLGQVGMIASDTVEFLPQAWMQV